MVSLNLSTIRDEIAELLSETAWDNGYPSLLNLNIEEFAGAIEDLSPVAKLTEYQSKNLNLYTKVINEAHEQGATEWRTKVRF